jgi:hypothetical protein
MKKYFLLLIALSILPVGLFQANGGERTGSKSKRGSSDTSQAGTQGGGGGQVDGKKSKRSSNGNGQAGGKKAKQNWSGSSKAGTQGGASGGQAGGSKKRKRSSTGTSQAGTQGGGAGHGANPQPTAPATNALRLSDLRVKNNVSFVGRSPRGVPIYRFSYVTEPNKRYQGTIAQAVAPIRPDAVIWQNGLMLVDYSRLDLEMEELPSASVEEAGAPTSNAQRSTSK